METDSYNLACKNSVSLPEGSQDQRVFLGPNLTLFGEFLDLRKKRVKCRRGGDNSNFPKSEGYFLRFSFIFC